MLCADAVVYSDSAVCTDTVVSECQRCCMSLDKWLSSLDLGVSSLKNHQVSVTPPPNPSELYNETIFLKF